MSERIPCINPSCRRTAAADKYGADAEIVCGKCFRTLPKQVADRYRSVRRRGKAMVRKAERRIAKGEPEAKFYAVFDRMDHHYAVSWAAIKSYFTAPPAPAGLENFLKENGLG
jgi:hypothetical protein